MNAFQLIHDYKQNDKYRDSFNQLAKLVFGIDFERWYSQGYWYDKFVCFSYLDGDKVVANVSVSRMDIICQGDPIRAIQVGAVMTHPDYRGRGLAAGLMNAALDHYAGSYDLAFLFGNETVLQFYPRFGFQRTKQNQFSAQVGQLDRRPGSSRKLDLSNSDDLGTLLRLTSQRIPVSQTLGATNDQGLLMFYCTNVHRDNVHYLPDADVAVIFRQTDDVLHLLDVISAKPFDLDSIIRAILPAGIATIKFHFTPEGTSLNVLCEDWQSEDGLFILPGDFKLPERFMFPALSIT